MRTHRRTLGAAALSLLLLWVPACGSDEPDAAGPRSLIGERAPDIAGANVAGSGDTGLASYEEKPMAVVFWVNVCPHCRVTMPKVDALQEKLGDGMQILSVAIHDPAADGDGDEGFESPAAATRTMDLSIPTVVVERSKADREWRLTHVPTAFVLDRDHMIVDVIEADAEGTDMIGPIEQALRSA